jgi:hypothetical protein
VAAVAHDQRAFELAERIAADERAMAQRVEGALDAALEAALSSQRVSS